MRLVLMDITTSTATTALWLNVGTQSAADTTAGAYKWCAFEHATGSAGEYGTGATSTDSKGILTPNLSFAGTTTSLSGEFMIDYLVGNSTTQIRIEGYVTSLNTSGSPFKVISTTAFNHANAGTATYIWVTPQAATYTGGTLALYGLTA
jgi:hypothetical protein